MIDLITTLVMLAIGITYAVVDTFNLSEAARALKILRGIR